MPDAVVAPVVEYGRCNQTSAQLAEQRSAQPTAQVFMNFSTPVCNLHLNENRKLCTIFPYLRIPAYAYFCGTGCVASRIARCTSRCTARGTARRTANHYALVELASYVPPRLARAHRHAQLAAQLAPQGDTQLTAVFCMFAAKLSAHLGAPRTAQLAVLLAALLDAQLA